MGESDSTRASRARDFHFGDSTVSLEVPVKITRPPKRSVLFFFLFSFLVVQHSTTAALRLYHTCKSSSDHGSIELACSVGIEGRREKRLTGLYLIRFAGLANKKVIWLDITV